MKRQLTIEQIDKKRTKNLISNTIFISIICLIVALRFGYFFHKTPTNHDMNILFNVMSDACTNFFSNPIGFYPNLPCLLVAFLIDALIFAFAYDKYSLVQGTDNQAHGSAYFETDFDQYNKEFVYDPKVIEKVTGHKFTDKETPRNEEGKKVIKKKIKPNKSYWHDAVEECKRQSMIYTDSVYLSLNGSWCQRNTNSMVFGASGTGKSRYFLKPNILQDNGSFICTDPSGDIMLETGDFLKKKNYIIKSFNISDMTKSCRFNPLYYVRDTKDIAIIVQTFIDNMKQGSKSSGDGEFWDKTTKALLCAVIGILYEVYPIEQRNWSNVAEILRMDKHEEGEDAGTKSQFDLLFEELGEANPISYAYAQYKIYTQAPVETRNNILISTSVNLQQLDIPEVKNLTYKDEMELDMIGHKKMAIFLNIPQADATFSWLTAMLYSLLFKRLYLYGETRMNLSAEEFNYDAYLDYLDEEKEKAKQEAENNKTEFNSYAYIDTPENREKYKNSKEYKPFKGKLGNPEMKIPVRFLIDECANVGKIPDLEKYLATCRKYRITICPIFQNYSQIVETYGKEKANNIVSNCDAFLFLGGSDDDTMKIIQGHLGKKTVKALSQSVSHGQKQSNSDSKQQVGQDLMARDKVETISNADCILFIRALHPFHTKKYNLNRHPNYKYLSEGKEGKPYANPFKITYEDEEIEANKVKPIGMDGHITPKVVDSASRRNLLNKYSQDLEQLYIEKGKLEAEISNVSSDNERKKLNAAIKEFDTKIEDLKKKLPIEITVDIEQKFKSDEENKEISDETKTVADVPSKIAKIKQCIISGSYSCEQEFEKAPEELLNTLFN